MAQGAEHAVRVLRMQVELLRDLRRRCWIVVEVVDDAQPDVHVQELPAPDVVRPDEVTARLRRLGRPGSDVLGRELLVIGSTCEEVAQMLCQGG